MESASQGDGVDSDFLLYCNAYRGRGGARRTAGPINESMLSLLPTAAVEEYSWPLYGTAHCPPRP